MKIVNASAENFASYKSLEFSFEDQGLALIHGPTGAGKSTLCDLVPWVLYGITAKNGAADDVVSWGADAPTYGTVETERYTIFRSRGHKQNDLYYRVDGSPPIRGKDLKDTQKLINEVLGMDSQSYIAMSYYHELSLTASFFTATAAYRRQLCESFSDLTLAATLVDKISLTKKAHKKELTTLENRLIEIEAKKEQEKSNLLKLKSQQVKWTNDWEIKKAELEKKAKTEEADRATQLSNLKSEITKNWAERTILRAELKEIQGLLEAAKTEAATTVAIVCPTCGAPKNYKATSALTEKINAAKQKYSKLEYGIRFTNQALTNSFSLRRKIKAATSAKDLLAQHLALTNPYQIGDTRALAELEAKQQETTEALSQAYEAMADLEVLEEVTAAYRKLKIQTNIELIEQKTNELLYKHFDAELRVTFTTQTADKLEINLFKNGNNCAFAQLSKGQRQLLKLCFGVAVMLFTRHYNQTTTNIVFFDEALDGMDDDFKAKAFSLFDSLQSEFSSIFVVEHSSDFKERFTNKHKVTLVEGSSQLEKSQ